MIESNRSIAADWAGLPGSTIASLSSGWATDRPRISVILRASEIASSVAAFLLSQPAPTISSTTAITPATLN